MNTDIFVLIFLNLQSCQQYVHKVTALTDGHRMYIKIAGAQHSAKLDGSAEVVTLEDGSVIVYSAHSLSELNKDGSVDFEQLSQYAERNRKEALLHVMNKREELNRELLHCNLQMEELGNVVTTKEFLSDSWWLA